MVGAVSFQPYVSSYQYTGYPRLRTAAQNMQTQAGTSASTTASNASVSAGKTGSTESAIGARSLASAGHTMSVTGVAAGRAADPETPVEPVDAASKVESGTSGSTNYGIPFMRAGMDPAELAVRMRIEYVDMPQSGKDGSAEAAGLDLPGTKSGEDTQAAQIGVSGTAAEAVQPDLPGTKSEEAVELNLPGTKSEGAVQLDLPGTSTDKVAESGLPGSSAEEEQTGVSGKDSKKDTPKVAGTGVEDTQKTMNETECKTCKERKYQDGSNDPGVSFKTPTHVDPGQTASAVRGHELEHVVRERARAEKEGRRVISQSVTMQTGICPECGRVYVAGGVTRTTTAADTKPKESPKDPKWILNSAA